MCGIFGYIGSQQNAATIILDGLKALEYRGYDSWGVAVVPTANLINKIMVKKKAGKISDAAVVELPASSLGFGHTRWATHGGVTDENAHPHLDCTGRIALVHNGIIENYDDIKRNLIKKGHTFISETDTEVAVHLIEELCKNMSFKKAFQKAFQSFKGLNAIIAIKSDERKLLAVRTGSPLIVGFDNDTNYLASDASALLPYTKQVHFLEDNQMAIMDEKKVTILNARTGANIQPIKQTLTWSVSQTKKGKYPFFMIKEIYEQPIVLRKIITDFDDRITGLTFYIRKSSNILLSGCGTAHHAAIIGKYLFAKISDKKVDTIPSSEFSYAGKFLDKKSFALFFSQSGETIDVVEAIDQMKKRGVPTGAITNRLGSTAYRIADYKVLLDAGPEICVLSTKSFTAKLAMLLLSSYSLARKLSQGKVELAKAVDEIEKILSKRYYNLYIKNLTRLISKHQNAYIIGRGISYPVSLEAALKIKEVTYIHTEAFPGGELKHGVIALIEKGSPCIVFAPHDETYTAIISNAMEIKARGGHIIGISDKPNSAFDSFCPVENVGNATIIPNSVVAQLIGYYIAIMRNIDPDKPRNLAKSVTVR